MQSDDPRFWDERFRGEGAIWGEGPSATAKIASRYLPAQARILEIGFGYGRNVIYLLREGYRVWGVDFSPEALHQTTLLLQREGLTAERLMTGSFEDSACPERPFDGVVCHRMAHLLVTDLAVERFVVAVVRALRPGGILCLGVRNSDDMKPNEVRQVGENVHEYTPRPGHLIRYWDDGGLRQAFGKDFRFLETARAYEDESVEFPVPCHLTIIVAKKIEGNKGSGP